jgi:multiple sugar transport system ATP-binding protein
MASVTFDHVTKRFGDVIAVNDLNLEINDKEFVVLVGPSGCGKTTSLRLVAGLEEVDEGSIYIGDRLVNDVAPKDRDIAMVFQSYALYPHMSVYDNLAFGLRLRKTPKVEIDGRVKNVAEMLGIGMLLDRKPRQLSGGQRQRVALGRAIVREPVCFLMDEPLSNLDAKLRVQTRAELIRLHQRLETTTIYVTHDQTEAITMGQRIAVQRDGLLQQLDTPQNLYERPTNVFVAGFIGSPSMNFFDASISGSPDELWIDCKEFRLPIMEDRKAALIPYLGKSLTFGIRPEDLHDPGFIPPGVTTSNFVSRVDVIEPMGAELFVYLESGTEMFIARLDPRSQPVLGTDFELAVTLENVHLFDRETQQAIR